MFDGGVGFGGTDGADRAAAPYVSWPASEAAFAHLKAMPGGIPDQVRQDHLSGLYTRTVVTQTMAMFRFMGLTDAEDRPTPLMHEFIAAFGTPDWPRVLRGAVERAYPRIVALDLSRATREQLDEEFRAYPGSSEAVRAKAVGFFVAAALAAGIPLNPELAGPRRRSLGEDARRRLAAHGVPANALFDADHVPPHGEHAMPTNALLAAVPVPHAPEPQRGALLPPAPETPAARYRAAFAALSAAWEPDTMPEDVDAAVVTVLRYLRRKEAEAAKA